MKSVIWNEYLKCNQIVYHEIWSKRGNTAKALYPTIKERTYYGIKVGDIFLWWKSRKTAIKYAYLFHTELYDKAQRIDNKFFTFRIHLNPWTLYKGAFGE